MGIAIWPEGNRQNNSTCGRLTGTPVYLKGTYPAYEPRIGGVCLLWSRYASSRAV